MKYVSSRLTSSTGCQRVKHGPRTILLKLLTILLSGSPFQWWTRQQLTAGLIPQQSQLKRSMSPVRHRFRVISVKIVELAGTNQFLMFATVNTKKFPREYTDQVISLKSFDGNNLERAPGPGLKKSIWFFQDHQWKQRHDPSFKPQAPSVKHHAPIFRKQASSPKLTKVQATSFKPQATSFKLQAASFKLHDS